MKPVPEGGRRVAEGDGRVTHKMLNDNELDAVIVRALSRLPQHAPSRHFANAVMARVALPQPRPVRVYGRALSWLRQPRHAFAFATAYVVAASLALVVAVPWLVGHVPALQLALDWTVAQTGGLIRSTSLGLAEWWVTSGLADAAAGLPRSGPRLWLSVVALTAVYGGSAIGLRHLLRAPKVSHGPVQVSA